MGTACGRCIGGVRSTTLISRFRLLWLAAGLLSLGVGAVGIIMPLLPTTPFLLLTAYCFAQSSPKLHRWLHEHATFGPLINNWNQYGSIDRRSKWLAVIAILLTPIVTYLIGVPWWALAAQLLVLAIAATFVVTRPDPPKR